MSEEPIGWATSRKVCALDMTIFALRNRGGKDKLIEILETRKRKHLRECAAWRLQQYQRDNLFRHAEATRREIFTLDNPDAVITKRADDGDIIRFDDEWEVLYLLKHGGRS